MNLFTQFSFAVDAEPGFWYKLQAFDQDWFVTALTVSVGLSFDSGKRYINIFCPLRHLTDFCLNSIVPYLLTGIGINCSIVIGVIRVRKRIIFLQISYLSENFLFLSS